MSYPIGEFSGNSLSTILDDQFSAHINAIKDKLYPFEPIDTFVKWHNILLSIEEFINIPIFGIDDKDQYEKILSMPLDHSFISNMRQIKEVKDIIALSFSDSVSNRFLSLMLMTSSINLAFKSQGIFSFGYGLNLDTVGNAIAYYQSRRRYFVTFLYVIPKYCKGVKKEEQIQLINEFLPVIEISCIALTTINYQKMLSEIYQDLKLISDGVRFTSNYDFQPLERLFTEPERISIIDQVLHRANQTKKMQLYEVDKKKIFSTSELKNSINIIEAVYSLYEIEDSEFKIFKDVIYKLTKHSESEYFIKIKMLEFEEIISIYPECTQEKVRNELLNSSLNYFDNLNSYHPLIKVGSNYLSNINLLMRFLYYFKNVILNKDKKFQVHSGFVFEDIIKKTLLDNCFKVTDIKRINRQEFDVVTIRNNVIYNFQCKNNSIDLALIESKTNSFIRYNNYLVHYYSKSLLKEKGREYLLIQKLGINKIENHVISRFPVITQNRRILSYNNLETWIKNNFN